MWQTMDKIGKFIDENRWALAIIEGIAFFGLLVVMWCWYIMLAAQHSPA